GAIVSSRSLPRCSDGCAPTPPAWSSRAIPASARRACGDRRSNRRSQVGTALAEPHREALEGALTNADAKRPIDGRSVGAALRAFLIALAALNPVVLGIDDLQWLDGATCAALAFAVRRLEGHRVGVLATVRAPVR